MFPATTRLAVLAVAFSSALAAAPKLTVARMALQQYEDGPELAASYEFLPGETAYFSCRLSGYQTEGNDQERHVKLAWQLEVFDPAGVPLVKSQQGNIQDRLLPEDKNWLPKFLASFTVPPFAPSGNYRISVHARDELDGSSLSQDLVFRVRGRDVEPSPTLAVRNFRFLSGPDDQIGVRSQVYHPGGMLWARFDITGYKFGPGNRFDVSYGLAIENAEGKRLFTQPEAASDSHESFYPQRYVPGMLSLNLDKNVATGMYTLVVILNDRTGGQTAEEKEPFRVE
jgi:hypothetical protein